MAVLILLFIIFVLVYYRYFRVKLPLQTVNFYSGGLGSGKTFLLTKKAIALYRSSIWKYRISKILNKLSFGLIEIYPIRYIYSNYPIKISKKKYSRILSREHLLGIKKLPEYAIVVIDEASAIFPNQARKSDIAITYNFRWFRHFVGGTLLLADQSVGSIDIEIRRRINIVYYLSDFKSIIGVFYKVNIYRVLYAEDIITNTNSVNTVDNNIMYGVFGLRKYASRYYKYNYPALSQGVEYFNFKNSYLIEEKNKEED